MRPHVTLLALLVLLAAGCGGDKAGGSGGVVTLRIGTDDSTGRVSGDMIDEFARQTKALSHGRIRIVGAWRAAGTDLDQFDQRVARMVSGDELDLGVIPARAWDTEGVTSLRALHAPFLVDSEPLMARIAQGELAGDLLSGLRNAGVVGLALLPEALRHPFGFDRPLTAPADFAGRTIRAPRSQDSFALLRALGARPIDVGSLGPKVKSGEITGVETSFTLADGLPRPAIATANVTLFPKFQTLVVGANAWAKLDDSQRETLREAARRTVTRLVDEILPETEAARRYCVSGGTVIVASEADVRALTIAARPVYAELERDPRTKAMIAHIRALARAVRPPTAPSACAPEPSRAVASVASPVLNGVWRANVSHAAMLKAGVPRNLADSEAGLQTIRLDNGRFDWRWRARDGQQRCLGRYVFQGDVVVFTDAGDCNGSWEAAYRLDGRSIHWSRVRELLSSLPYDQTVRELLHQAPWQRIDEPPEFPEGVYRTDVPVSLLIDRGVDAATAHNHGGLQTMTFKRGRFTHRIHADGDVGPCGGNYSVTGERVSVHADTSQECGDGGGTVLFSARWTLHGGNLRLLDVSNPEGFNLLVQGLWGSRPWRKIG